MSCIPSITQLFELSIHFAVVLISLTNLLGDHRSVERTVVVVRHLVAVNDRFCVDHIHTTSHRWKKAYMLSPHG